jgi:hypothetical protein
MPGHPPGDRAVILACSVRSLRQFVLDAECACGRCVHYTLELMAAGGLAWMTIASAVVQLRRKNCGRRPGKVALKEHGAAGTPGMMGDRGRGGATGWLV